MDFSLFYSDGLHLVEKGNLKLGKSILKAIDSNSNANLYKIAVCFNLNECDFPPLPSPATTSKPVSNQQHHLVRITTATFPSHIPNICYTDASILKSQIL